MELGGERHQLTPSWRYIVLIYCADSPLYLGISLEFVCFKMVVKVTHTIPDGTSFVHLLLEKERESWRRA